MTRTFPGWRPASRALSPAGTRKTSTPARPLLELRPATQADPQRCRGMRGDEAAEIADPTNGRAVDGDDHVARLDLPDCRQTGEDPVDEGAEVRRRHPVSRGPLGHRRG